MPIHMPYLISGAPAGKNCADCEYFDAEFGDCLSRNSPRFQTSADRAACPAYFPDTWEADD